MLFLPTINLLAKLNIWSAIRVIKWVDMLGMDNYGDFGRDRKYNLEAGIKN
jgi:hypothetical protein